MSRAIRALSLAAVIALFTASNGLAQITEFESEVVESPALDGQRFGEVGQYERLRGIVTGAVDPADRATSTSSTSIARPATRRAW